MQDNRPVTAAAAGPAGSAPDTQQILNIEEDASLQDLIAKMEFL